MVTKGGVSLSLIHQYKYSALTQNRPGGPQGSTQGQQQDPLEQEPVPSLAGLSVDEGLLDEGLLLGESAVAVAVAVAVAGPIANCVFVVGQYGLAVCDTPTEVPTRRNISEAEKLYLIGSTSIC